MGGSSLWTDPRVARLFSETPERFVASRNALAAELVAAGDPAAGEVRALRRPTRRVWILNRLARERPEAITRLLETGEALRKAHAAALEGEGARLREADEEMSRRLDELVRRATALLERAGEHPDHAVLVALRTDLRALAAGGGPDAERLRAGTLDHVPAGARGGAFGDLAAAFTGTLRPRAHHAKATPGAPARAREEAARVARARADLRRNERALATAERTLQRRERETAAAEAAAAERRARADEARRAVEAARERLARARKAARA